jgi:phosphomethylpyrimidine synthase
LARGYHDEDLEVDTDFCAMCGHDWCSVRISKEINGFYSGKDEAAQPAKKALASPGVNDVGREILEKRGVLSQAEIMKLGHKGKRADCHSDNVKEEKAAKVVQLNTLKAHGVKVNEGGL